MRKKYFYFVLTLLFSTTILFGQKVTLTPLLVNGKGYTTGSINLGSYSTSSITLSVQIESPVATGNDGNINIYYVKTAAMGSITPSGGNGGSLFFGGGKIATRSFVISLNSSDFNTSGGYIYAEYKNASGVAYKSSNITVIKDGTPTNPTNPTTPPQPITKTIVEKIPYGGTPLLPQYYEYSNTEHQEWVVNDNIPFEGMRNDAKLYTPSLAKLKQKTTLKDGTVYYSDAVNVYVLYFLKQFKDLYVDNKISSNQYLNDGESPNTIIGNQASETHSVPIPGVRGYQQVTNPLTNYQWQARIKFPLLWANHNDIYFYSYGWTDIPGATQINYTPPKTDRAMEYRRLVLEDPLDQSSLRNCATSNVVSIVPLINDSTQNIICCDQTLTTSTRDVADPIIGDYTFGSSVNQWQISEDGTNWKDIFGKTNKDCKPSYVLTDDDRRGNNTSKTQYYRRLIYNFNDNKFYTSNTAKINYNLNNNNPNTERILVYPNPTASILNIESSEINFINAQISIVNVAGNVFIPNSTSIINSNSISLDVSNFITGTYFINIQTSINYRRSTLHQVTFIKN
ncbi:T9SS type A sorting domain-containing protein [Flavobacterium sp. AJR]|uniref:T9SS type A sorting domain-containing protein n=1 Tax=Flavobacterium sp. AJR TaxID=1979369 RepID=UPI000A3D7535|nr:T9SS type A sorting domain-containing protein [Flavobacterium sp. AJR]OUL62768.1 hypothetical protein B8T70_08580 [Flavobacterium sp. AJR]